MHTTTLSFLTWVLGLWTPACVAMNLPAKPSLQLRVVSSGAVPRVAWVWHLNKIFAAVYASALTNPARKRQWVDQVSQRTGHLTAAQNNEGGESWPDTEEAFYEARNNDNLKVNSKMVEPVGFELNKFFKDKVMVHKIPDLYGYCLSVSLCFCVSLCVSVSGCVSGCVCQSVLSVCVHVQCTCMCLWMPEETVRSSSWGYR